MRTDCGDVRFVDEDGNPLSYWIEPNTIDTPHTVAWVKVNLAPNEHKLIYMLYGNPTATTTANGDNTFPYSLMIFLKVIWIIQNGLTTLIIHYL